MSTGQASGPVWVRQGGDGTEAADWAEVDLTLEVADDGSIRPKAHPADVVLAGQGVPESGALVSAASDGGESVDVEWADALPAPRLEGPRATYEDIQPGVDLVLEVTRTGFEQFYVLTERPDEGAAPELGLTLRTEGLAVTEDEDGGVSFTDVSGEVVGTTATPLAWDAAVDGERLHPITEPWEDKGEAAGSAMAPPPPAPPAHSDDDVPPVPAEQKIEPLPTADLTPPLPADAAAAGDAVPDDAGRAASDEASAAKASPGLPLKEAIEVVGDGDIAVDLTLDEEFLQDRDTQYPVVIDPEQNFNWGFDAFVQTGINSDHSGSTELRIGTYDGGATVARSFVNFDFSSIPNRFIHNATLHLWEFHSYSCAARNWQVWSTGTAGPWVRINAQPGWWGHWSTSSQTTGYSAGCNDNWVAADVTSLVQAWSSQYAGEVTMGLKAENEGDTYGWKKFNSANAGWGVPTVYINWSSPSGPATGLSVAGSVTEEGVAYTSSRTPTLSAVAHDPDGAAHLRYRLYRLNGPLLWEGTAANVADGQAGPVTVPAGIISTDGQYTFEVYSYDWLLGQTGNTAWHAFTVDSAAPLAPTIASVDYKNDGQWHQSAGVAGAFTLTLPVPDGSLSGYMWGLDKTPDTKVVAASNTTLTVTPPTNGIHVLQVQATDRAGSRSGLVKYTFNVGRAGLISPADGARVVRRVRLTATGEDQLPYVQFAWRRGPDTGAGQPINPSALATASGRPMPGTWTQRSSLGDYAVWDAGSTLGFEGGPLQVQAVLAADANGTGAYATGWVTVTVDPDAEHAASDSIGPGSVNLLTGDFRLSSTDVDEFGLSVERTTSSRDTDAGLEMQADLLTPIQQTISDAVTGYHGINTAVERATNQWHSGNDSLKITSNAGRTNSVAYPGQLNTGDIKMRPGRTYRISGWVYVPAANGLVKGSPDSPRITAHSDKPGGGFTTHTSNLATQSDTWQRLSVDFPIPRDSKAAYLYLYNGFAAAGAAVYYDDLSVREIWAPMGPEWSLGIADQATGTAYTHISQPYPDIAELHFTGGGSTWFTAAGGDKWWPQPGAESLTLTGTGDGNWTLSEIDGTVSTFARQGDADSKLVTTSPPAPLDEAGRPSPASSGTRLKYEIVDGRVRLQSLIAPVENGVDGWPTNKQACTGPTPPAGCEVLQLVYSSVPVSSSPAGLDDRLTEVRLLSAPSVGVAQTDSVVAARYSYDADGRLREVWDPRISPALKTTYEYVDGRVTTLGVPGELPWTFQYGRGGASAAIGGGIDVVDRSSGRLLRVSRAALRPGSVDQPDGTTASTVVYAVPITRAAGGPHDLDADTIGTWAQRYGPTDATAIFGPEDDPQITTATASSPGKDGYRAAIVHYLDASGREVNTATPAGPDAPAGGYIDTAEHDQHGNVVWSLDATNRLLALGQLPSAATDLANLGVSGASSADRAVALATVSTYGPEGLDLLRTRGPLLLLAVGNNPNDVQKVHDVTEYRYDEGKPDGVAYHLVTTQTEGLLLANGGPDLVDKGVTRTGYDPIDGKDPVGPTSGWVLRQPTVTTVDAEPGGKNLTARVRYDEQGKVVESRKAGSDGTDAATVRSIYYTAGANSADAACGNVPAYAGLPCVTRAAGAVAGHDASRMAGELPVKRVTGYNRYGSITSVTEAASGPVAGATVTQSRTTTTTYDAADRVTSVAISGTGAGTAAVPLGRTVSTYDPASGDVVRVESRDPVNDSVVVSATAKTFDALGRMTRYDDGAGGVTTSVFDRFGKPIEVTDSLGTTTRFTYDRTAEPRGYVTSVTDSVAGTISAKYGADGELLTETLPGGVQLTIGYDANRTPNSRTYERVSDGDVISASSVVENSAGQWVTHSTSASSKRFSYDRIGRLTGVQDTTLQAGVCTARAYGFDDRAQRTSMTTAVSGTSTCADPGSPGTAAVATTGYVYDTADRLVTESTVAAGAWVYDPLGRITTAPVRGSPGAVVQNAFYANDLVASQTIDGVARQSWKLDALQRFSSYTNEEWAVGGNGQAGWQQAVTKVNHYDSDSDSPAWIAEDASLPDEVTRYVDGLDGNLAVQTGKTGGRVLQLVDLHGDVMTTLPIRDGESTADWTALRHQAADEYGNPTDLTTGTVRVSTGQSPGADGRYGWLGGKQRSADALAGVLLMGVRLYDPGTGRFWSVDPVPGGNATAYDYCSADPVNCFDLDGRGFMDWVKKTVKKAAKVVAVVAEVASNIPGPIGAAASAVGAVAYAATGNKGQALLMAASAAAALVGAGAAVRAGVRAYKAARAERAASLAMPAKSVQHAFNKHAADFGVSGKWNKAAGPAFAQTLRSHVAKVGTVSVKGSYRGKDAITHVGVFSRRAVVTDRAGTFVGAAFRLGWRQYGRAMTGRNWE